MQKLSDYIRERAIAEAKYVIEKQTTVRATARAYNVSKSTVHMDITKRLEYISLPLYTEVKKVLQKIRTKELNVEVQLNKGKYLEMKKN